MIKNIYIKKYKNTTKLPITKILKIIEHNFYDNQKNNFQYEHRFNEIFNYNKLLNLDEIINEKNISNKIDLDKFIEYLIYYKSKNFLDKKYYKNYKFNSSRLKYQTIIDLQRQQIYLNNKLINFNKFLIENNNLDNYQITDKFILLLMEQNNSINFNIINKICILVCQNLYNFICDLLQIELIKKNIIIGTSVTEDINGEITLSNSKYITIDLNNLCINYYFDSYLFNDKLEKIGKLNYKFKIDLINNNFKFKNLFIDCNLENKKIINNNFIDYFLKFTIGIFIFNFIKKNFI